MKWLPDRLYMKKMMPIGAKIIMINFMLANLTIWEYVECFSNLTKWNLNVLEYNIFFQPLVVAYTLLTKFCIVFLIIRTENDYNLKLNQPVIISSIIAGTVDVIVVRFIYHVPLNQLTPQIKSYWITKSGFYVNAFDQSSFNIITALCSNISLIVIFWYANISTRWKVLVCSSLNVGRTENILTSLRNSCT